MDKINMINYQRLVLQTKFGKRNEKKQNRFLVHHFPIKYLFLPTLSEYRCPGVN